MTFIKMSQGRGTEADAVTRNFFKEIAAGLWGRGFCKRGPLPDNPGVLMAVTGQRGQWVQSGG